MSEIQKAERAVTESVPALIKLTASGAHRRGGDLRIEASAKESFIQISFFHADNKVTHLNLSEEQAGEKLVSLLPLYKQWDISTQGESIRIYINRTKDGLACSVKKTPNSLVKAALPHDRVKNYILDGSEPWLAKLGVTSQNGKIFADMQKKFRQINKFLEFIKPIEQNIPENAVIYDMGCGKAYLTFALYDYLTRIKGSAVNVTGVDRKADVMANCAKTAAELGYDGLSFVEGDISDLSNAKMDMAVCLHACDTATDLALFAAESNGAKVILAAPCCHHELFSQAANNDLRPMLKHGILKERFCTLLTDSIRALLLESRGYRCEIMEFIEMEHTPKNILLCAVKIPSGADKREQARLKALELMNMFNVRPTLYNLFYGE